MKTCLSLSGLFVCLCLSLYAGTASASTKKNPTAHKQYDTNILPGEGSVTSQSRAIEPFTSVSVNAPVEVTVVQGDRVALALTGYANHLAWVKTQVKDGRLIFSFDSNGRRLPHDQKIRATVELPGDLVSLSARGQGTIKVEKKIRADSFAIDCSDQGDVTMTDLQTDRLTLNVSHQGDVELAGSATDCNIRVINQGDADLKKLTIDTAECTVSDQGDCTVYVVGTLKAVVSNQGDLVYYGNPKQIEQQVSGQADLTKGK